jgi:outer membrane protein TolC
MSLDLWYVQKPRPYRADIQRKQGKSAVLPAFLLGLLLAALPDRTAAQETPPVMQLTPDDAVSLAVKNNLNLQKAGISVETLRRKSELSWNQFIPSLTVGGSLLLDNEKTRTTIPGGVAPLTDKMTGGAIPGIETQIPLPNGKTQTIYDYVTTYPSTTIDLPQWHIAGQVQLSLQISAAMFEGMKTLQYAYLSGQMAYETAAIQMEREVRKAYNQLLLAQEQAALLKESYDAANRLVAIAQANYNAGLQPELAVLQQQVSRENMRPQIEQAESGIKIAMARFADTLGLPYNTPLDLIPVQANDTFISFDVTDLIQKASANKPEIQALRQDILGLESQRKAKQLQLTPALTLSWTGSKTFTGDPWKDSWFDNDWKTGGSFSIGLGWKLDSLLPFSASSQGIKDTEADIQSKNVDIALAVRSTEIEIYNIVLTLDRVRLTAETKQKAIELAEKTTTLTEQAYRAGLQDFLQVQNAVLELRKARVSKLEEQYNYLNGLIDLEYAIGVPFGTLSNTNGSN